LKENTIKITIVFAVILAIFLTLDHFSRPVAEDIPAQSGSADAASIALDKTAARIPAESWNYYPNKTLSFEDLGGNTIPADDFRIPNEGYGTCNIKISLPKGKTYGFIVEAPDTPQSVFINGGGQDAASGFTSYFFTPQTDQTDILIQYSEPGSRFLSKAYVGEQSVIAKLSTGVFTFDLINAGFFITAGVFGVLMFAFFGLRKKYLFFAFFCVSAVFYVLFSGSGAYKAFNPSMAWDIAFVAGHLSVVAAVVTFALFINDMFPRLLNKWVIILIYLYSAAFAAASILAPPAIVSMIFLIYEICSLAFGVYAFIVLMINARDMKAEKLLVPIAIALVIAVYLVNKTHAASDGRIVLLGISSLISACIASLILQFSVTERKLAIKNKMDSDFSEAGKMVGRINRMKSDLLFNMPQDMQASLKTMPDYPLLTSRRQVSNSMDIMQRNLENIAVESNRLSLLAMRMLHAANEKQNPERKKVQLSKCAEKSYDLYSPMFDEKRNTLTLETEAWLPSVDADESMIMQVILHLLTNANSRTQEGTVTMSVSRSDQKGYVLFSIHDTGSIISHDEIIRLMKKDHKPDKNSPSSGLFIAREIIEAYGGSLHIFSGVSTGTSVSFELPGFHKEDETDQ